MPAVTASRGQRVAVAGAIVAIVAFSTVSHQLTPFFMVVACAVLVLIRRCQLRTLPILLAVIFAAWVSFGASGFWSGHINDMFGGLGDLGSNLSTSVSGRTTGNSSLHKYVLYSRDLFAATVLLMAGLGLLRRRRLQVDDRVLVVLTAVPFLGFGLQSYGGEMALRVYLFALPAAAVLAAMAFFPAPVRDWRPWRILPAVAVAVIAAIVIFFVPRYGNESFERTPVGEVAATNYLSAHDSQGIHVLWLSEDPVNDDTPQIPWQYKDIEKIDYEPHQAPLNPASVATIVAQLRASGPGSYVMTTTTQEEYLEQAASYQPNWGQAVPRGHEGLPRGQGGLRQPGRGHLHAHLAEGCGPGAATQPGRHLRHDHLDADRAGRTGAAAARAGSTRVHPDLAAGEQPARAAARHRDDSVAGLLRHRRHHPVRGPRMTAGRRVPGRPVMTVRVLLVGGL